MYSMLYNNVHVTLHPPLSSLSDTVESLQNDAKLGLDHQAGTEKKNAEEVVEYSGFEGMCLLFRLLSR